MNKKGLIVLAIVFLILIITSVFSGITLYKAHNNNEVKFMDNKVVSTITMDINPSFVIGLNKNNEVIEVKSLNEDGKKIIEDLDLNEKSLDTMINNIVVSLSHNNYLNNDNNTILINVESNDKNLKQKVQSFVVDNAKKSNVSVEVIMQTVSATKELQKIADEYNISISKAYYINEKIKNDNTLKIEDYVDSSIEEINSIVPQNSDSDNKDNTSKEESETPKSENSSPRTGTMHKCERVQSVLSLDEAAQKAVSSYGAVLNPSGYCDVRYASSYGSEDPNGVCAFKVEFEYMTDKCTYYVDISNGNILSTSGCVKRNISVNDNQCIIMRDLNIKHPENLWITGSQETASEFITTVEDGYGTLNTFEYHISKSTGAIISRIIVKEFDGPSPYDDEHPRPDDI